MESQDMNIIDGIISIIFEYLKCATWSKTFKGSQIVLSDDDTKAICVVDRGHSVRADFAINRGEIVSWTLKCLIIFHKCSFYGVVSSKVTEFDDCPKANMDNAYGIDDRENHGYTNGLHQMRRLKWYKPGMPVAKEFILKMTADWTEKAVQIEYIL